MEAPPLARELATIRSILQPHRGRSGRCGTEEKWRLLCAGVALARRTQIDPALGREAASRQPTIATVYRGQPNEHKLEVRWEIFKVPNFTNFLLPERNIDLPTAGVITQAQSARRMQVALKYIF